jgi:hypothetical protein
MTDTAKFFQVKFTEQTGSSISSSVWVNPTDYTPTYDYLLLLNGTQDPNAGSWNWINAPYYQAETTPSTATFNHNIALTRASRTQVVTPTDYMTIAVLNGDVTDTNDYQDIYSTTFEIFNGGTSVAYQIEFNEDGGSGLNSGGPRAFANDFITSYPFTSSQQTSLMSIGMGPANITDLGLYDMTSQPWTHYTVTLNNQEDVDQPNFNGVYDKFTIYKDTQCTGFEPVRFIWSNEFGVWDYFNFKLATNKVTKLEKENYRKTFVDYSTSTNDVPYNITNRGVTNYFTNIDEEWIVNSDWLTQEQASWLEYLIYSPRVFIQQGTDIVPIIVTNTEFINKTNPKSQKLFKYEVTYKLANPKRPR